MNILLHLSTSMLVLLLVQIWTFMSYYAVSHIFMIKNALLYISREYILPTKTNHTHITHINPQRLVSLLTTQLHLTPD